MIIFRVWLHGWGQLRVCCGCGKGKNLGVTSVSAPKYTMMETLQFKDIFRTLKKLP